MDRFRCMLLYLAAGRGPEREMTFVVEGEEPFYWTALKPVTCYGYPADARYGLEAPPLVRCRVDGEGGWLEACDFELDRRPLDRVRLFSSGDGGRRFHSFRFVWAADGRRVRFEIDGRVEAVAELAAKRLSVRGGDGGRAFHALWSKQGHGWDESLLEAFDRVPEALLRQPVPAAGGAGRSGVPAAGRRRAAEIPQPYGDALSGLYPACRVRTLRFRAGLDPVGGHGGDPLRSVCADDAGGARHPDAGHAEA